ncbi:MAG: 3'(2'),5'-bisphosphate nucleotidase [bacterium]|nr:3'(2'),5'-bisphosphate nucleotidase [bacterium]
MFERELEIGKQAVIEAMRICRTIQDELTRADSITKSDKSPVTIADFASQAVVCRILNDHFPDIPIVGEESSGALQKPEHREVLQKILYYIEQDDAISKIVNKENLFRSIDLGDDEPTDKVFWTLDPIDGTKGFLRGEQFAVALALIVEGDVNVGLLGCPNLEIPGQTSSKGYLLSAVKGEQTQLLNVENGNSESVGVSPITETRKMRFVESYVSAHSNMDMQLKIAHMLEMETDPVQMDSQVKYAVVATGNAEIYLRIPHPKTPDYKEKIWDHAAGSLIVECAGGVVSDIMGQQLDFMKGKTLKDNRGIFASIPSVHNRILGIIRELG